MDFAAEASSGNISAHSSIVFYTYFHLRGMLVCELRYTLARAYCWENVTHCMKREAIGLLKIELFSTYTWRMSSVIRPVSDFV